MHFDFRPLLRRTFAELSRKDPTLSAGPSHQQGGKENTRGLGVWLSQSLTFGSLAAAFGACSLRLPKPTLVQVLQDHGIWLTFGSLAATYGTVQKKTAGPRAARGGSP